MFTDEVYITKVPLKLFGGEVYDKSEKYLQKRSPKLPFPGKERI